MNFDSQATVEEISAISTIVAPELAGEAIQISVVIPCLNEAKSIAFCIDKAFAAFRRLCISGEVVVSDNGSTDSSTDCRTPWRSGGARRLQRVRQRLAQRN